MSSDEFSEASAATIHGCLQSEESDSDSDHSFIDNVKYNLLKPPPLDFECIKDKLVPIQPLVVSDNQIVVNENVPNIWEEMARRKAESSYNIELRNSNGKGIITELPQTKKKTRKRTKGQASKKKASEAVDVEYSYDWYNEVYYPQLVHTAEASKQNVSSVDVPKKVKKKKSQKKNEPKSSITKNKTIKKKACEAIEVKYDYDWLHEIYYPQVLHSVEASKENVFLVDAPKKVNKKKKQKKNESKSSITQDDKMNGRQQTAMKKKNVPKVFSLQEFPELVKTTNTVSTSLFSSQCNDIKKENVPQQKPQEMLLNALNPSVSKKKKLNSNKNKIQFSSLTFSDELQKLIATLSNPTSPQKALADVVNNFYNGQTIPMSEAEVIVKNLNREFDVLLQNDDKHKKASNIKINPKTQVSSKNCSGPVANINSVENTVLNKKKKKTKNKKQNVLENIYTNNSIKLTKPVGQVKQKNSIKNDAHHEQIAMHIKTVGYKKLIDESKTNKNAGVSLTNKQQNVTHKEKCKNNIKMQKVEHKAETHKRMMAHGICSYEDLIQLLFFHPETYTGLPNYKLVNKLENLKLFGKKRPKHLLLLLNEMETFTLTYLPKINTVCSKEDCKTQDYCEIKCDKELKCKDKSVKDFLQNFQSTCSYSGLIELMTSMKTSNSDVINQSVVQQKYPETSLHMLSCDVDCFYMLYPGNNFNHFINFRDTYLNGLLENIIDYCDESEIDTSSETYYEGMMTHGICNYEDLIQLLFFHPETYTGLPNDKLVNKLKHLNIFSKERPKHLLLLLNKIETSTHIPKINSVSAKEDCKTQDYCEIKCDKESKCEDKSVKVLSENFQSSCSYSGQIELMTSMKTSNTDVINQFVVQQKYSKRSLHMLSCDVDCFYILYPGKNFYHFMNFRETYLNGLLKNLIYYCDESQIPQNFKCTENSNSETNTLLSGDDFESKLDLFSQGISENILDRFPANDIVAKKEDFSPCSFEKKDRFEDERGDQMVTYRLWESEYDLCPVNSQCSSENSLTEKEQRDCFSNIEQTCVHEEAGERKSSKENITEVVNDEEKHSLQFSQTLKSNKTEISNNYTDYKCYYYEYAGEAFFDFMNFTEIYQSGVLERNISNYSDTQLPYSNSVQTTKLSNSSLEGKNTIVTVPSGTTTVSHKVHKNINGKCSHSVDILKDCTCFYYDYMGDNFANYMKFREIYLSGSLERIIESCDKNIEKMHCVCAAGPIQKCRSNQVNLKNKHDGTFPMFEIFHVIFTVIMAVLIIENIYSICLFLILVMLYYHWIF